MHPGVLGAEVSVEQGADAARWCALNALSVLELTLGDLDRIERVLTVLGFVASAPGFVAQPAVVDGASRLLYEVFGDAGRHSRSAVGVAALPRGRGGDRGRGRAAPVRSAGGGEDAADVLVGEELGR